MGGINMNLTIGAWLAWLVIILGTFGLSMFLFYYMGDYDGKKALRRSILITIIVAVLTMIGFSWYYTCTAKGERARKTQDSNLRYGLNRKIEVYDATGNLIKTYEGKFDIEYDSDRIIFDDENRLRHIIYYPTGTVIIDEVE